jgi:predicted Zn-dependent protease
MRSKDEIRSLVQQTLSNAAAPQVQVEYTFRGGLATRFGENAITQNTGGEEEQLRLTVAYDKKHGASLTNTLEKDEIAEMVNRAEEIARDSFQDPEYMPPVQAQTYPPAPQRFDEEVRQLSPADAAEKIEHAIAPAKASGYRAGGLFEATYGINAIGNSEGLFAFDQFSNIDYSTTVHGAFGSGFSSDNRDSMNQLNTEAVARTALETAKAAQNPKNIEPGDYTVIFEPHAVYDFLLFLFWNMSARDADEGTTVFSGKVGQKLFSDKVTIKTRIDDPDLPSPPFGLDGLPARPRVWFKKGVLERLRHDRFWADQRATDPDPALNPLTMEGEDQSIADLISRCRKGLLVKRLWYIRYVDRKELLLTGMTRDGLFLVKNGEIVAPVKNLRFNESPVVFLRNVVAMSRPKRIGGWTKVPGIMSEAFTFSSKTESV